MATSSADDCKKRRKVDPITALQEEIGKVYNADADTE